MIHLTLTAFARLKEPSLLLCKAIVEGKWAHAIATDPTKPSTEVQVWNLVPVSPQHAARYQATLQKEQESENEKMVEQKDIHAVKKALKLEKYGLVTQLSDAVTMGTHLRTIHMSIENLNTPPTEPTSVVSQCNDRLLALYRLPLVANWAREFELEQPQLPLYAARAFEHNPVHLANGLDHVDTARYVKEGKFSSLYKQPYIDIVKYTKAHCDKILHLASNKLVLEEVPPYCPASVHPRKLAIQQGLREIEAAHAASRREQQQARPPPVRRPAPRPALRREPVGDGNREGQRHQQVSFQAEERPQQMRRLNQGRGAAQLRPQYGPRRPYGGAADNGNRRDNFRRMGSFTADAGVTPSFPANLGREYCLGYLFTGELCESGPECTRSRHIRYDDMPEDDRRRFEEYIAATTGLWFSNQCRTVPSRLSHKVDRRGERANGNRG